MTDNNNSGQSSSTAGRLVRHSAVYGLGSILSAAAGFVLLPLYTNNLALDEYGVMEILNRVANIAIVFIFLGTRQAFVRFYFDQESDAWKKKVTSTTLSFLLLSSVSVTFLIVCILLLFPGIADHSAGGFDVLLFFAVWIPFEAILSLCNSFMVARQQPVSYIVANGLRFSLFVGLTVVFVSGLEQGLKGVFLAKALAAALIGIVFLIYFWRWSGLGIDRTLLRRLFAFGLPYIPAAAFMYIISNADRFALGAFWSLESVGLYGLGAKIGTIGMVLLVSPLEMVWGPFIFSACKNADGPRRIGDAFTVFSAFAVWVGLGVALAGPIAIRLFADSAYMPAQTIVPAIALGGVLYGMACLIDAGVLIAKQTRYKPMIFGSAAAMAIVLHLLITPKFGLMGAALATAGTFATLLLINYRVSERFYPLNLHVRDFFAMFASAVGLFIAGRYGLTFADNLIQETLLLLVIAAAYIVLFTVLSRFSNKDVMNLIREIRGRKRL